MINIESCKEIGFDAGHSVVTAKLNGINSESGNKHTDACTTHYTIPVYTPVFLKLSLRFRNM